MAEEGKKISFGFSKSIKKTVLKNTAPQEEKKVDYIECLDEKSIKVIGEEEKKDEPLVIPLLGSRTWHDRIVNKIDADIFEPKTTTNEENNAKEKEETEKVVIKEEKSELSNGNLLPIDINTVKIKTEPSSDNENVVTSLEEQAAKEIIQELKSTEKEENNKAPLTLTLTEVESLKGQEQSTLDDYERIPVDAFGLAMLRGMGWQPGKGIGKNEKIVKAVVPELRPKGMGLGADKVTLQKQNANAKKQDEELKIEKGTFVKIIAGKQSDSYGQIEGFDDDAGRLIVKLALGGNIISLNEFMVQPVTKSEYSKNAKVLNVKKYEEYKDTEAKHKGKETKKKKEPLIENLISSEDDDGNHAEERSKKPAIDDRDKSNRTNGKKSKSRKRYSETESDSDSDYGKKAKLRSRSSSSDAYKSKKSKKSKKHKKRDSSSERSSKKHKRKDKEKEKSREKKLRDTEYVDRKKHKKRGRSRSRSSGRR